MWYWKSFGLAIFVALYLLSETAGSAHAQTNATEWSGGSVINLDCLPFSTYCAANGINDAGQVVGESFTPAPIPEPSTWAMMLLGFAGLAFGGYRRARAGHAIARHVG